MKRGLELEYWVIDEEGALTVPGRALAELSFVEREAHPSLIEVKTAPHESLSALRAQLCDRLDRALRIARTDGLQLAPVGTALAGVESVEGNCRRSQRIDVQRHLLGDSFRRALACAGTHVHFEQFEPAAQLNALIALDPGFALLNTTPYSDGRRVAACARPYVYRRRCYAAYPALGRLWRYAESVEEWRHRLRDTYERFKRAATTAGVPEQHVEQSFDEATAVWGPVRLRDDLSTVEWRAPDAALPSQVLQLVGDASRVVERVSEVESSEWRASEGTATSDWTATSDGAVASHGVTVPGTCGVALPSFDRLQRLTDAAMAHGLTDRSVRRYLAGLGFRLDEYRPIGRQMGGPRRLSSGRARKIRRRLAIELEEDVARLREGPSRSQRTRIGGFQ